MPPREQRVLLEEGRSATEGGVRPEKKGENSQRREGWRGERHVAEVLEQDADKGGFEGGKDVAGGRATRGPRNAPSRRGGKGTVAVKHV